MDFKPYTKISIMFTANKLVLILAFWVFSWASVQAQDFNLDAKIPNDPAVRTGQLSNGLKYYIKKNAKPKNRVELRLVVNAGSLMETDEQQGLAHFVEHMCFNGTKNFPKSELVDFLEKAGVKFGAHLNAYTSFDETVYKLQLPTDKKDIYDKGFQVLEDWAHNVSFDDEEIDKERGVVIEEWRLGLGANERMRQKTIPIMLKDSRYAERLPIGKLEILKNFKHQTVRDFYNDWYRPDLMAVIVVGDIDADEVEAKIKTHFSRLTNPKNEKKRETYDIPNNKEPLVVVATDKETTYPVFMMYYKHDKIKPGTLGVYRKSLVNRLYRTMITERISELTKKSDAPFLFAQSGYGGFVGRTKDAYTSIAVPKGGGKMLAAIETLVGENMKVKQYGFTQGELDRAKKAVLSEYDKYAKEADKTESRVFADEFKRNFLVGEVIPGIKVESTYVRHFIPEITLAEINALAPEWMTDENIVVVLQMKDGKNIPTEAQVLETIKKASEKKYQPYVDKTNNAPLLDKKLKKGKVIKTEENKDFGVTTLTFANGVKVILKPTDFKNDEILFLGRADGGSSIASDEDIFSANYMAQVINQSGFADFSQTDLSKKLAGNTANLQLTFSDTESGMQGSASPKDFETLLKLNYQYFTNANKDEDAFKTVMSGVENQIKFFSSSPDMAFYDKIVELTSLNSPRAYVFPTAEDLETVTLDKVYDFYNKAFKDASGYTFFIVGNFDIKKIKPLLEKYIGSLPVKGAERKIINRKDEFPTGITEATVFKGKEPKSSVAMVFAGDFEWSRENYYIAQVLMKTLSIKLRETMREDQSGVYGVAARISVDKEPEPRYKINISWGCSPENADKLSETVLTEMRKIAENGPTDEDIAKAKKIFTNERESQLKENKFWLDYLKSSYTKGADLQSLDEFTEMINNISKEQLKEAAQKYFTMQNYVQVVLRPETK